MPGSVEKIGPSLDREVGALRGGVEAVKESLSDVKADVAELFKALNDSNLRSQSYQSETVAVLKHISNSIDDFSPRLDAIEKDRTIVKTTFGIFTLIGSGVLGVVIFWDNLLKLVRGTP